jgi:primary-amine oxidase
MEKSKPASIPSSPNIHHNLTHHSVYNPLINFDNFFDGESLEQEDLVLWFNLGMHHIPHTGDLPNTVFTTAHSAVQISPSNYFSHDQSRDTVNMVRLSYNYKKRETEVITFGQAAQICEYCYVKRNVGVRRLLTFVIGMANLTEYGYY